MDNYVNTEKSLKRWLKTKVKVTMATVVGFLITGTVAFGATYDGDYTNKDLFELGSSKLVTGKDGNLTINTDGSAYELLKELKNAKSLEEIRIALWQDKNGNGYKDEKNQGSYVVTGALAGQGRYNQKINGLFTTVALVKPEYKHYIKSLKRFHTVGKEKDSVLGVEGNLNTVIGEKNSPVVLGLIGGDFALGAYGNNANKPADLIGFNRTGNASVTINNGNLFGATVGSTAVSAKNISAKVIFDIKLDGSAETTINGNTTLNVNGGANVAGVTAGGLATAIGGKATSNVNGNTNININTEVDGGQHIDGITAGIFGGGMAVSTLGGEANANTTGKTTIDVTNGLSVGLAGGGLAVSTDASQYIKDKDGTLDGTTTINPTGLPPMTFTGLNDGGTSTVKSGDVNVSLLGGTSAALVLGSGVAVSHQNAPQGKAPTEKDKLSTSTVEVGNTNITVNVNKNLGENKEEIPNILVGIKGILKGEKLTENLQKVITNTKDKGMVVGLAGNGISVAADKGISTVTAANTNIDLQNGYVVGVLGNGISTGNAWTKSTTNVTGKSKIDVNGAEVIGLSGNGLAFYYGSGNYNGTLNFDGKVVTEVKDSEINIIKGSVDGVFGGGIAIDDSEFNTENAFAKTSGTSIINVTGGKVEDFGYEHLNSLMQTKDPMGTQDIKTYYKEVASLGEGVAIFGGGVAAGNKANAYVENSVINITGGKVTGKIYKEENGKLVEVENGDIVAGGIATAGATSIVKNSTINITGGEIIGSLYGQGKGTVLGANPPAQGNGHSMATENGIATVENSLLNIDGYKNSIKNISGFDKITISKATDMKVNNILLEKGETLTNSGKLTLGLVDDDASLITINGGEAENDGTLVVKSTQKVASNTEGKFTSAGTIQISDKTKDDLKEFKASSLFGGKYTFTGMLKDKNGNGILQTDDVIIGGGDYNSEEIINVGKENNGEVNLGDKLALVGGEKPIDVGSVNVYNDITVKNDASGNGVTIENTPINIDKDKHITIGETNAEADLTITSGQVNGKEGELAIDFAHKDSSLALNGTSVTGNIGGKDNTNGSISVTNSTITGDINANELVAGDKDEWDSLFGQANSVMLAKVGEAKEIKTTTYNGDITINEGRLGAIDENVVYNGSVTYKGTKGINIGATTGNKVSAKFDGNVVSDNIRLAGDTTAYYASNITLTGNTIPNKGTAISGGTNVFEVTSTGKNALGNTSDKVVADKGTEGVNISGGAGVKLDVSSVEKDLIIDLGDKTNLNGIEVGLAEESKDFYGLFKVGDTGNKYKFTFKQDIASGQGYSKELDGIMSATQSIHGLLNDRGYTTAKSRIPLADRIYAGNIYSETMKTSYDNTKLIEDGILSFNTENRVGEWTANGKAIYDKNEYDRKGTIKDYSSEIESSGLMATLEYGLNETTSAGVVFAGVKQDVTSEIGTADGDAFYLGLFANKELGDNKFTAGLGYQLDKFDATNGVLGGGDKYDSSAVNVYAQAKHIAKFDGISFEPKVKVGYTYVDQDEVRDGAMKLDSQDMNVFDVKVGLDVVKEVTLENSNLRFVAGVDFTKLYGDIDDKYVGGFYGTSGERSFNVLGANLTENSVNFTLGAELETEKGFFYNVGATYTKGSENTENYGANLGIGYKF